MELTEAAEKAREDIPKWRRGGRLEPARLGYQDPFHRKFYRAVYHVPGMGADRQYHDWCRPLESDTALSLALKKARGLIAWAGQDIHYSRPTPRISSALERVREAVWLLEYAMEVE